MIDRRQFLTASCAAGLVPALPALPARAAVSLAGARVTSSSRLLWASLYARAGSTGELAALAGRMGMPARTAQSVASRIAGQHALVSAAASRASVTAPKQTFSNEFSKRLGARLRDEVAEASDTSPDSLEPDPEYALDT